MKKIILTLLLLLVLPLELKALEVTNLEDTLSREGISQEAEYTENDEQVTIYLFRGSGCSHCAEFLEFLSSNIEENGQYFKLRAYEVWKNPDNNKLAAAVAKKLGTSVDGVPFIVVGDQYFSGFSEEIGNQIMAKIKEEYESEDRVDVLSTIDLSNLESNDTLVIVGICAVIVVLVGAVVFAKKKNKETI